jgi:hypothetical protein
MGVGELGRSCGVHPESELANANAEPHRSDASREDT